MITGKIWGHTTLLLETPMISVHRLNILPWSRCSLHCHRYKCNAFFVVHGEIEIEVHKNDYPLVDHLLLTQGQLSIVRPCEYHLFRTFELAAEVIEIYYPEPLSEDIIRQDHGETAAPFVG